MKEQLIERFTDICKQIEVFSGKMRNIENTLKESSISTESHQTDSVWNVIRGKRLQALNERGWLHEVIVSNDHATDEELIAIRETIRQEVPSQ